MPDVAKDNNYDMSDALYYVIMTMPRRLYEVFPLAILIGCLFGLGALAASSELIVIRAAGVSIGRITGSVLMTGILLMFIHFAVGEWIAPYAEQEGQNFKSKEQTKGATKDKAGYISLKGRHGAWIREQNHVIRIKRVKDSKSVEGMEIFTFNKNRKLVAVTSADKAIYFQKGWTLHGVKRSLLSENGVKISRLTKLRWGKLIKPKQLGGLSIPPQNQALAHLSERIKEREANRVNADQFRLAFWIKVFTPFSTLVMMVIAIPFIFKTIRTTNTGQRLLFGVLIGLGFYLLNRGLNSVGLLYGIPPMLSAALPSLLFAAAGLYAIRRVG
jgi:lipopolysaccharide export system permease protein